MKGKSSLISNSLDTKLMGSAALILVGGFGTRLRPLVRSLPLPATDTIQHLSIARHIKANHNLRNDRHSHSPNL